MSRVEEGPQTCTDEPLKLSHVEDALKGCGGWSDRQAEQDARAIVHRVNNWGALLAERDELAMRVAELKATRFNSGSKGSVAPSRSRPAKTERDAALATIERVRALLSGWAEDADANLAGRRRDYGAGDAYAECANELSAALGGEEER